MPCQEAGFAVGIRLLGVWQTEELVEDSRELSCFHHDLGNEKLSRDPKLSRDSLGALSAVRDTKGPTVLGNSKFSSSASKPAVRIG